MLRVLGNIHVHTAVGLTIIVVGVLLIMLLSPSEELVVDHHQEFTLEARDYFSAGTTNLSPSTSASSIDIFPMYPVYTKVGESYLDEGVHSVWIERLEEPRSMQEVISLHLEDEEGFVCYINPSHRRMVERSGVEYERLFVIDVDTPGVHSIETYVWDDDYDGEELDFMVTHDVRGDTSGSLIGRVVFLSGLTIMLVALFRYLGGLRPIEGSPSL